MEEATGYNGFTPSDYAEELCNGDLTILQRNSRRI